MLSTMLTWARWLILAVSITMTAVLVATAWRNHQEMHDATRTLARGQGELLLEQIVYELRDANRPPAQQDLDKILATLAPDGLVYIGIRARVEVTAGDAKIPVVAAGGGDQRPGGLRLRHQGERVQLRVRPPAPPRGLHGPGPGGGPPMGPPRGHDLAGMGGPGPGDGLSRPVLTIEFIPRTANQLVAQARTSLWIACGVGAALLGLGAGLFGLLRGWELRERKRLEREHLASLGEMSAVLAHELRNPLAALKGHAQLLEETMQQDPRLDKARRVVGEAERLETLTNGLLEFVRTAELQIAEVSPAELALAARGRTKDSPVVIDVDTRRAPDVWMLDRERMLQVLVNLLDNARQATSSSERVKLTCYEDHGMLVFEVADSGPGLPTDISDMFAPFQTTRAQGTGLGLAVAQRIIRLHNGSISARNRDRGGAIFEVRIPAVKETRI